MMGGWKNGQNRDFAGGPLAKPEVLMQGPGFISGCGTRSHMPQ